MIKKYNEYINESLLDKLSGPSEDELLDKYKNNPIELLKKSIKNKSVEGIELALNMGANETEIIAPDRCDMYAILGDKKELLKLLNTMYDSAYLKNQLVDNLIKYKLIEELIDEINEDETLLAFAIKTTYVRNKEEIREILFDLFKLDKKLVEDIIYKIKTDFRLKARDEYQSILGEYNDILKYIKNNN